MAVKAVIFDLDGTLGDTLPVVVQAFQETFLRYGGKVLTAEEICSRFGPSEEGLIRPLVPAEDYEAAVSCYIQRYNELHRQVCEPFAGVVDMLAQLKAWGIHCAIVTGKGPGTAQVSMEAMGLAPYIEAVKAGSAAGAGKPASLRELLDGWGLRPEEAAYVGDMPYDMQAAREAGLIPLGAAWAESTTVTPGDGAEQIFTRVADLLEWVGRRRR